MTYKAISASSEGKIETRAVTGVGTGARTGEGKHRDRDCDADRESYSTEQGYG